MTTPDVRQYTGDRETYEQEVPTSPPYCEQIPVAARELPTDLGPDRLSAILATGSKWVNATVLHYSFFTSGPWAVPENQRAVIRQAFGEWKALGVGLEFSELNDLAESEIRIG